FGRSNERNGGVGAAAPALQSFKKVFCQTFAASCRLHFLVNIFLYGGQLYATYPAYHLSISIKMPPYKNFRVGKKCTHKAK
ncbi:MAG: hypothetical protein ACI4JM_11315, partial [Oscillospiraceae bacterium]